MVRQSFRLSLYDFREVLFERVCDGSVQVTAAFFQEAGVGGVAYERVLEAINRMRNLAPPKNQFRLDQLIKRLFEVILQ